MYKEHSIVINQEILIEKHLPSGIIGRESQINEIKCCLWPLFKKRKPMHVWIYGRPGTGKTLLAKHFLRHLEDQAHINGVYINCWEQNSYYSILDKLVRELRILGAEKLNTAFKLERFQQFIGQKPFVVVLDEIDQIKPPERDSIIYNLCNIGNIGLICISNSRIVFHTMDERIKSRLNARAIEFGIYDEGDLTKIMEQRAEIALAPGSWNSNILKKTASMSKGDARIAFQTLKNASYHAENDRSNIIKIKHINEGYNYVKNMKKTYLLDKLTSHYRMLYELVKRKEEIQSGELWKLYLKECRKIKKPPIALRTYSEYMNKLIELELVQWDRALVRGKVRVFKTYN